MSSSPIGAARGHGDTSHGEYGGDGDPPGPDVRTHAGYYRPRAIADLIDREIRACAAVRTSGVWNASDEALVAGLAGGDRDAALVLVRRFQARVFGLALSVTRDRGSAEEAAQDTFVKAWRYAASFDPRRGPVTAWLLTIARNAALDQVRAQRRRVDEVATEPLDDIRDLIGSDDIDSPYEGLAALAGAVRALPRAARRADRGDVPRVHVTRDRRGVGPAARHREDTAAARPPQAPRRLRRGRTMSERVFERANHRARSSAHWCTADDVCSSHDVRVHR